MLCLSHYVSPLRQKRNMYSFAIILFVLCYELSSVVSSNGDRSYMYQNCLRNCVNGNCTSDGFTFNKRATIQQDIWCKVLRWQCTDECKYLCMWSTVKQFQNAGVTVPKFHGKWPFKRILGVQEPASAFSSMLNLATNIFMYIEIKRNFPVRTTPLVLFWHAFAVICMNAWVWSTIFHTRDTLFTEFMDYACALSMVMGLFVAAIVRVFHKKRKLTAVILFVPMLYYGAHVKYLYSGKIDYDYNMVVNIIFGVAGALIWLLWGVYQYSAGMRFAWRVVAFTSLSGAALALELLDFPPKYDAWDAHALWHLTTAPLPLLFYRYVIDDLRAMQTKRFDEYTVKSS